MIGQKKKEGKWDFQSNSSILLPDSFVSFQGRRYEFFLCWPFLFEEVGLLCLGLLLWEAKASLRLTSRLGEKLT